METWFIIVVSLCITTIIKFIILRRRDDKQLPPGPPILSAVYLRLTNPPIKFKPVLINLKARYGSIFALSYGFAPSIFVSDHSLAYQILIQKGAVFSDRPKSVITRTISTTSYGPAWRILRRNLATEIMHPPRVKSYSGVRKWMLRILIDRLQECQDSDGVKVVDHFRYAMFSLLVFMCFGEKVGDSKINELAKIQRNQLISFASGRFAVLTLFPNFGKILFRNRWKEYEKSRRDRDDVIVPLIKSRVKSANPEVGLGNQGIVAYVDTLVNLQYPREDNNSSGSSSSSGNDRRLTDTEIASLCSEFLNAGVDTTTTALQWIMANIVKHPHIQSKLYDEIVKVVGPPPPPPRKGVELESESVINEEDLQKMPYLKAVVLEGLRRHPPVHFLLPHKVTKKVDVQGYTIPQGSTINFMVSEMGLDPNVWDEPMEFKPERFLVHDGVFDISGRKGIKMMPFGAGRRICPGSDLALLHLEYFVANLIWYFNWTVPDGYEVDLSEKTEFGVVMKNPLTVQLPSRA